MAKYETKLSAGQMAWFMQDNKAMCLPVGSVKVKEVLDDETPRSRVEISYGVRVYENDSSGHPKFKEWKDIADAKAFASKEELLASL